MSQQGSTGVNNEINDAVFLGGGSDIVHAGSLSRLSLHTVETSVILI